MTDFDRLSRQQKCLTFYEAKAVYSNEGCGHGPLVFKSGMKGLKAHFLMKLLEFLLAYEHCVNIINSIIDTFCYYFLLLLTQFQYQVL